MWVTVPHSLPFWNTSIIGGNILLQSALTQLLNALFFAAFASASAFAAASLASLSLSAASLAAFSKSALLFFVTCWTLINTFVFSFCFSTLTTAFSASLAAFSAAAFSAAALSAASLASLSALSLAAFSAAALSAASLASLSAFSLAAFNSAILPSNAAFSSNVNFKTACAWASFLFFQVLLYLLLKLYQVILVLSLIYLLLF